MLFHQLVDIFYILSPVFAFIPQICRNKIVYSPLLSILSIISSIVKIMHYRVEEYNITLLYQFIVGLVVHAYLIRHYSIPLRRFENIFFRGVLMKQGLFSCAVILVMGFILVCNFFYMFNYGHLFGDLACILDVLTTFLQLLIYSSSKEKPKEAFVVWLIGDVIKIAMLIFFYKSPIEYTIACGLQLAMNCFTLFKTNKCRL